MRKWIWVLWGCAAAAQVGPVSLKEAVEQAVAHYPAVRASQAEAAGAGASVELARAAYLPRTDLILLANRATRNNVFGLLFPQSSLPSISGPVLEDRTSYGSVFGSAAGALFSWEPFDFGLRQANVNTAAALRRQAEARATLTRFEVAAAAADAFLHVVAAREAVQAAQANVERMRIFAGAVTVLVKSELRPGADESRARAELAAARTVLIRAEQNEQASRATLAEWMGAAGLGPEVRPGRLLEMPTAPAAAVPALHPAAAAQEAAVEVARARQHALERAYYPRFNLQSSYYGRGTGARTDGRLLGGANGLAMNTPNWAVGMSVTFPVFDWQALKSRKQIEAQNERAEAARFDQRTQELAAGRERARVQLDGARRVAENTPVEVDAARTLEQQARVRYQAGLANVVEVAEAQRLLTQAEIGDALARLGVWQALLAQAIAEGDIGPLVAEASR